jgi:hypothetical protein
MCTAGLRVFYAACVAGAVCAQSIPQEIGNRAHGFSYQPTQQEVRPLEAARGIRPTEKQQTANDRTLERIDRDLLQKEGVASIPSALRLNP